MNTLQKCLEELDKEKPRLDYIRGMIETLIEMGDQKVKTGPTLGGIINNPRPVHSIGQNMHPVGQPKDEGSLLDATARANLAKTIELAGKSLE